MPRLLVISMALQGREDKAGRNVFLMGAVIAALLILQIATHLRHNYLWQDEAETALVAKTILTHGVPMATDGRNSFSQVGPLAYNEEGIWTLDPWLPFYVTALSFSVFGVSDWAARLPFALLGLLSVGCSAYLAHLLFGRPITTLLTGAILSIMVPFLLLVGQCRWYAAVIFFFLLALIGYTAAMEKRKRWGAPLLFVALVLIFHCRETYYYLLIAILSMHALLFHRPRFPALPAILSLFFTLPWTFFFSGFELFEIHQGGGPHFLANLSRYFNFVLLYLFPYPALIFLLLFFVFLQRGRLRLGAALLWQEERRAYVLVMMLLVISVVALAFLSGPCFFRYLAPFLPLAAILLARAGEGVWRLHRGAALLYPVILLLAFSWPSFVTEPLHDYRGPMEGIVRYLNTHGRPGDTVVITYGSLPLKFYTPLKVVGLAIKEDYASLDKYPRFIIVRKNIIIGTSADYQYNFLSRIPFQLYRAVEIDYPDLPWENRPSPPYHFFRTPRAERVVIHERI